MLREEIWPFIKRLLFKGARPDVQKELQQDGYYEMAQNMRPVSVDGTSGSLTSIGGEQVDWRPLPDIAPFAPGYVCIGACIVNGIKVAFWAHVNGVVDPQAFPPVITADGQVIAKSPRIPYRFDKPLDFGDVSKLRAGTVFPADHFSDPLFWDIEAMRQAASAGEQTYFDAFNIEYVSVLPSGPREWPEHIGSPNVGVGLPVGMYRYWLRFVTPTGDRTNPGPPTPLISVPRVQAPIYLGDLNGQYPGGQTVGGAVDPDNLTPTPYGIKLKFQVDNYLGYPILEIVRERHNTGLGLASAGIVEVVARISIAEGQLGYVEWTDPVDANFFEAIAPDDAQQRIIAFTAPKTVEHVDNRLVYANFRLRDRSPSLTWREIDGKRIVPITNRVFTRWNGGSPDVIEYNDGYADPVNATYMKGAMHNERQSFGLMIWDSLAGTSFVAPIEDNYKHPDKKDRKAGASLALSWNMNAPFGTPPDPIYGTNNECQDLSAQGIPFDPVSPTFDCIVQGTQRKYSNNTYTNIINGLDYNPLRPVSPTDTNSVRYRQMPVGFWETSDLLYTDVTGHMFAPQVHALGVAIAGPANIDDEAPYWEVMEVMATPEAGRVVAEGIACYGLMSASPTPSLNGAKSPNGLNCFFPDIDSGVVPASILNDIQANPQNYKVKLVPRGFGCELYSKYSNGNLFTGDTRGVDIINYMDVQFDNGNSVTNPQWSVNTGETPGSMGFQPTLSAPLEPTNYVGYGAFRSTPVQGVTNTAAPNYSVFLDPNNEQQGNFLFGITSIINVDEGRGSYVRITLNERVYRIDGIGCGEHFSEAQTRLFHEPFYLIQIIRDAAIVPQQNVQDYFGTGFRVARERTIGLGRPAGEVYDLELFHARVEDAVPMPGSGEYRYAVVRQDGEQDKLFICFTNAAPEVIAQVPAAQAAWAAGQPWTDPNGQQVWGAYTYVFDNSSSPRTVHLLRFGGYGSTPAEGARIIIRYSGSPIRAFGLGNTTAPAIFSPLDRVFSGDAPSSPNYNQFFNFPAMPYRGGLLDSDYVLPRNPNTLNIAEEIVFRNISSARQWVVMGHCVTRTPLNLSLGNDGAPYRGQFPERHYVMRPTVVVNTSPTNFAGANGLNLTYEIDYPEEGPWLKMGGFWTSTRYNLDYAKAPVINGKGAPRNGQSANLDYSNWHIASLKQIPGAIDTPGNRTFLSEGLFPISEENGPIMRIISVDQGGAQQLYGWTTRGVYRVMYNRDILYGADGNTVGTQFVDDFWPRQEMWLSRGNRGMPGQLWRCAAKVRTQGYETVCWVDKVSAYILADGRPNDIAAGRFLSELQPWLRDCIDESGPGYNALFNQKQGEWWFSLLDRRGGRKRMFVYSVAAQDWIGSYTYDYDQFLSDDTRLYGLRRMSSNELDVGNTFLSAADDTPFAFEKWAEVSLAPHPFMVSELVKWRVGPSKPDEFRVYDKDHVQMLITNQQVQEAFEPGTGQLWVLNIDGWEQMMGNVDFSYDPERGNPPQDVRFFLRALQSSPERFVLTFIGAHAKQIP